MSSTDEKLLWLWGKTDKRNIDAYHPLLFHLIDVGIVAASLWDFLLSEKMQQKIAAMMQVDKHMARQILVVLAALHDIGKCTPGFQHQLFTRQDENQPAPYGPTYLHSRLHSIGLQKTTSDTEPHGFVSTRILIPEAEKFHALFATEEGSEGARIWSYLTGGHHGTFPTKKRWKMPPSILGEGAWEDARTALIQQIHQTFAPDLSLPMQAHAPQNAEFVSLIGGLISVADWIASWQKHFPCAANRQGTFSIAEYVKESRRRAHHALREIGWLHPLSFDTSTVEFGSLFGFDPNPLQETVCNLEEQFDQPFLMIIETPMGSGKTEAALWACDITLRREYSRGFYFAMPTQATSDAIYTRLRDPFFKKRKHLHDIDLQLAHSNALLTKDNHFATTSNGHYAGDKSEKPASEAQRRAAIESWFSARKRPLLAPFGVGTIDQALMGVLQTKHWFVRQFGLHQKVIVFDEVHAVDVYQEELLCRLLQWLRRLDCSVILLSATLPSRKRQSLMRAWNQHIQMKNPPPYPRLSLVRAEDNTVIEQPIHFKEAVERYGSKSYHVALHPVCPKIIAETLRSKLEQGGCAVVFCNTVARAQEVFETLQEALKDFIGPDDWHLLHARMPMQWRKQRETKIRETFGRDRSHRPHRAIIVSTQVLEASMDFSVDFLMTELAPIDLLLQRLGREHRHPTDTNKNIIEPPPHLWPPQVALLCDLQWDEAPPESWGEFDGTVYPRSLLLRSWRVLRELPPQGEARVLILPSQIEPLIEKVYSDQTDEDEGWQEAIGDAEKQEKSKNDSALKQAEISLICEPKEPTKFLKERDNLELSESDDPQVHQSLRALTRYGLPSVTVLCLHEINGQLYPIDADGNADTARPLDKTQLPNWETCRDLLENAIGISHPKLYRHFVTQALPQAWQKSPHLRHTRLLKLQNGACCVGNFTLTLKKDLGLHELRNQA